MDQFGNPVRFFKLPVFLELLTRDPFAAWFVVIGDATLDGIRVVRSVLGTISSLPIVFFRELHSCMASHSCSSQETLRFEGVEPSSSDLSRNASDGHSTLFRRIPDRSHFMFKNDLLVPKFGGLAT